MSFNLILLFIWFISMLIIIAVVSYQNDQKEANKNKETITKSYGTTLDGQPVFIKNVTTQPTPSTPKPLPAKQVDKIIQSYLDLNVKLDTTFIDTLYDCTSIEQIYMLLDSKIKTRV